jgi:hypothetical protein
MTSISTPESSLSSRAMLCSLSISMWSARKHDPQASEEIAQRHGAQADAGRYHKVLLPKEALTEIHKIVSEARQEHYFMTLPWDDNGYRVLPAAAYMDHTEKMRALSNRFTPAVEARAAETRGSRGLSSNPEQRVPSLKDFFQFVIQDLGPGLQKQVRPA